MPEVTRPIFDRREERNLVYMLRGRPVTRGYYYVPQKILLAHDSDLRYCRYCTLQGAVGKPTEENVNDGPEAEQRVKDKTGGKLVVLCGDGDLDAC
jgi:hypothetical protein